VVVSVFSCFYICVHIQPSFEGQVFICDFVVLVAFNVMAPFFLLEFVDQPDAQSLRYIMYLPWRCVLLSLTSIEVLLFLPGNA
jgi:hypothetical protein